MGHRRLESNRTIDRHAAACTNTNIHIQANNAGLQGKVHVSCIMPGLINTEFGMNVVCFRARLYTYRAYRTNPVNIHILDAPHKFNTQNSKQTQIGEGRDARNLPSAQPVEEVCDVILDVIQVGGVCRFGLGGVSICDLWLRLCHFLSFKLHTPAPVLEIEQTNRSPNHTSTVPARRGLHQGGAPTDGGRVLCGYVFIQRMNVDKSMVNR